MSRLPSCLAALVVLALAPREALAQQSLFNVPAGTPTAPYGAFIQEQLNFGSIGESNFTAELGLPGRFEVGFNLLRVDIYGFTVSESARSALTGNVSYSPRITREFQLQFGGAAGGGQNEVDNVYVPLAFGWGVGRYHFTNINLTAILGVYAGTEGWLGPGWPVGPMGGLEWEVWPEKMTIMADLLFGTQETAVGVIGPVLLLPHGWQLSFGFQVPSPLSTNEYEGVIEITHVPLSGND